MKEKSSFIGIVRLYKNGVLEQTTHNYMSMIYRHALLNSVFTFNAYTQDLLRPKTIQLGTDDTTNIDLQIDLNAPLTDSGNPINYLASNIILSNDDTGSSDFYTVRYSITFSLTSDTNVKEVGLFTDVINNCNEVNLDSSLPYCLSVENRMLVSRSVVDYNLTAGVNYNITWDISLTSDINS